LLPTSELEDGDRSLFKRLFLVVEPEYKDGNSNFYSFQFFLNLLYMLSRVKMPAEEQRTK
jgi:hypothetical protein